MGDVIAPRQRLAGGWVHPSPTRVRRCCRGAVGPHFDMTAASAAAGASKPAGASRAARKAAGALRSTAAGGAYVQSTAIGRRMEDSGVVVGHAEW